MIAVVQMGSESGLLWAASGRLSHGGDKAYTVVPKVQEQERHVNIEHIAFNVAQPAVMAAWWCEHLGMQVVRQVGESGFFIADQAGRTLLEIYHNPAAKVPDYAVMDPLELHIAFASDDVQGDAERLVAAGGVFQGERDFTPDKTGNVFAIVRDPWGIPVQLVHRGHPLQTG